MIRRLILAALILATLAMVGFSAPTLAQSVVVASCPAATPIYAVGQQNRQPAMDVNGNLCQGGGTGASTIANGADVAQGSTTDVPCTVPTSSTACTLAAIEKAIANAINTATVALGQTTKSASVPVTIASDQAPIQTTTATTGGTLPNAATAIQGNATGSTGAVVGTLAAAAAKTTYLCDFDVSALGTGSSIGPIVIAGLLGGSKTYQMGTLATGTQQLLNKNFNPCLPGSAVNTAITITTTADATASAVDVNSSGYQQ